MRPYRSRLLRPLGALSALLLAPAGLGAQTTVIDEGAFRLTVQGREVGTESFSIVQTGTRSDVRVIARGSVSIDTAGAGDALTTSLELATPALRPAAYQVVVEGADAQRIAGRIVGGRFSAKILSPAGEQMREYLASDGAVLIDDGVAHHHFFLARRVDGGSARVPMIIPRQNRQVSAEVDDRGSATIEVGRQRLPARHLVVSPSGLPERHLWVDARGRVLRLEIPARGYAARRTTAPR